MGDILGFPINETLVLHMNAVGTYVNWHADTQIVCFHICINKQTL